MEPNMEFVASLTRSASELNMMFSLWQQHGDQRKPFRNVMITPLFMPPSGMKIIRKWVDEGFIENLYFDSGGFYVQMGRIDYVELFARLLTFYQRENWATWYVLPDNVPTSSDSPDMVWSKVYDTANYGRMFFDQLPHTLQSRMIPVVHGFTPAQIEHSYTAAASLETGYLGFGSFSTSGKSSSINKLTAKTHTVLQQLLHAILGVGMKLHAFGVSTPPVLHLLRRLKTFSFDSIGWMKTAGYGKVYMPYVRAYNVTYHDKTAQTITPAEFAEMKRVTGHECYFCKSFRDLHDKRFYRIMHNLSVIMDMIHTPYTEDHVRTIMQRYSPTYFGIASGEA
jgi:hypothetical protein